ncbi:uncharacterized protein LOC135839588 isoform X1 [Planococcus citri]|uniref:uncharacterized protein LOC135839588 isoform X1 n=1 Tax=Planococcus citri TaxID=170843 RepID=UPI0031F930E7
MEVAYGDLDMDNSSEKLFVFHESVSTLQEIASHKVALQLWHHYITRAKSEEIKEETNDFYRTVFNLDADYESETKKLAELLKAPRCIEKMLKKSVKKTCTETRQWICHFKSKIFTDGMSRYCPSNFDLNHIVWRPNGKIDYKKSASKVLTEGKLNAEQKFVIMGSFGMATKLERFPMNSLPEYFCLLGITDLKIAFWICYHRHDLLKIWLKMPSMIRPEDTSINVTMAMKSVESCLPYAFEYFWNRLSEAEQLAFALRILPQLSWHAESREIQKIMLSTMTSFQQLQLVDQIPLELMANFSITGYSAEYCTPENVFIIWTRIKDRITEQQFVKFLEEVLMERDMMNSEKYMVMLNNVWDTASGRLKRYVVENHGFLIFAAFMFCDPCPPSSYRLFKKFLPLMNEHARKDHIWSFSYSDSNRIARRRDTDILNLCIPKESDQLELKDIVMDSSGMIDYCANTLHYLEFDEVINAVAFFSRNDRDSRKFFKKLLESEELELYAETFIMDYENWIRFSNFINAVFRNYSSTISRLKKQLVSSFSARAVHCWDKKENFNVLVKITEQVFSTEEMKTFKRTLLEHFQKTISSEQNWSRFEGKCFNTFISWCSEDESRIIDLKDIVPIDAFFDDTFRTICSSSNENFKISLKQLDNFLKYVCVSDEEVELVKIRKYFEHDQYWIRRVEQIFPDDTRRSISNWFLSVKN